MKPLIEQLRDNGKVLLMAPASRPIPVAAIAGSLQQAVDELEAARAILEPLAPHDPAIRAWLSRNAGSAS